MSFRLGVGLAMLMALAFAAEGELTPIETSIGIALVPAPEGSFDMGSRTGDWDEQPVHRVSFSGPFWMSESTVTLEQYKAFRPAHTASGPNGEVVGVSWDDATTFCKWLSDKEGKPFRLPTEAEWEYACRASSTTPYASGDQPPADANWANQWGFKGMHDETPEWCLDWYGEYAPVNETDPAGPESGMMRVVRGAHLDTGNERFLVPGKDGVFYRRSANRAAIAPTFGAPQGDPGFGNGAIGFRIVYAPNAKPATRPAKLSWPVSGVKTLTKDAVGKGPDPNRPYFRKRYILPTPPETFTNPAKLSIITNAGLPPAFSGHNHCPAVAVCPNGDLLFMIYTSWHEYEPGVSIIASRLRCGADEWDMPEVLVDTVDANEHVPLLWTERDRIYLFWGNPWLKGGYPLQWMTSDDSGATWSEVKYPRFVGPVGPHARQPINSVLRAANGTLYVASDAEGPTSVLWATKDDGQTWMDTGGRSAGRHTTYELLKDGRILGLGGKNSDIEGYMPQAISSDGGKTWQVEKSIFPAQAVNQRPSLIRLKSGRLFFAADFQKKDGVKPVGVTESGSFVALSDDDGKTWHIKKLAAAQPHEDPEMFAGAATLGYSVARQSPDGLIHLISTMNRPCLHFAMNEAWILSDESESNDDIVMANSATKVSGITKYGEAYPDGQTRFTWSAGTGDDGRYLLHGKEAWYYPDGKRWYKAEYALGRKTGKETCWAPDGQKQWEWRHDKDGSSTWRQWWEDGTLKSETHWRRFHADGRARCWDRDGTLLSDVVYKDGLPVPESATP